MGNTNNVKVLDIKVFYRENATGIEKIELYSIEVDRGLTFDEAKTK